MFLPLCSLNRIESLSPTPTNYFILSHHKNYQRIVICSFLLYIIVHETVCTFHQLGHVFFNHSNTSYIFVIHAYQMN